MQVREAQPTEIPIIHALARKIWMDHYPSIISMEQIEYMLEKMYSEAALQQQLTDGHRFFILSLVTWGRKFRIMYKPLTRI